jgi:competence protein ComEA
VALVVAVVVTTLAPRGGVRELDAGRGMTTSPATNAREDAPRGTGARTAAPVLLVHVLGAVVRPGIVELRPGARVLDAIAAAGGLAADANPGGVNLARSVTDGEQLVVPREGEVLAPPTPVVGGGPGTAPGGALVNLNLASAAELQALPRIGPALAQRIVDWREAHGLFATPADLMKVSGIGQTLFDGLKDLVTV